MRVARSTAVVIMGLALARGESVAQNVPPRIGGVELGTMSNVVRTALGRPDREQESLGMRFWDYTGRGITVIWKEGDRGVHGIVVSRADGGDVAGVKVGDREQDVRKTWGAPARVRQDGKFMDYVGADWVLSIELRQGSVVQMSLLRATASQR